MRVINSIYDGKATINQKGLDELKAFMKDFVEDILGLNDDSNAGTDNMDELMNVIINIRNSAKQNKDFATSDRIREELSSIGIQLKDSKDGTLWNKI
ncbi:hypothetical protein HMPREF0765_1782 [Sphingobacterium spiritivorum ATCC 33300]|uniref:Cysteine--tRNA ligase n=1 Tax=Sphingobacterium spiritivorum ATCC 33300 TaxID=525372 RepID=C2FWS6_SPHSI|nr:hypothetical protein HMPREF0765_1782 [Sphingobacterium spiritivorum ATCC 33300]